MALTMTAASAVVLVSH